MKKDFENAVVINNEKEHRFEIKLNDKLAFILYSRANAVKLCGRRSRALILLFPILLIAVPFILLPAVTTRGIASLLCLLYLM